MISFSALDMGHLSPEDQQQCRNLLEEKFWSCLEGKDPWGIDTATIHAIDARSDGTLIGLAVATFRPVMQHARVLSVSVATNFQYQHIGTQLLEQLESLLLSQGCMLTSHIYQTGLPITVDLESILQNLGWTKGQPFSIRCHFIEAEFQPAWLYKPYRLPPGYAIFFWRDLKDVERQFLLNELIKENIPPSISPFRDESTIEPINSLGLRKDGNVVGWIIVNRIAPNTLQYSSIYIRPDYRFLGYSIYLLAASIKLQKKEHIKKAILELNLIESNSSWVRFVKNRLLPNSEGIKRFNESYHFLRTPDDESKFIDFSNSRDV